jgi:hypothetical protein
LEAREKISYIREYTAFGAMSLIVHVLDAGAPGKEGDATIPTSSCKSRTMEHATRSIQIKRWLWILATQVIELEDRYMYNIIRNYEINFSRCTVWIEFDPEY